MDKPTQCLLSLAIGMGFALYGSWLLKQSDVHLLRAGAAAVSLAALLFGYIFWQTMARGDQ